MKEAARVTSTGATGVDKTEAQEQMTLSELAADKAAAAKAEDKKLEEAAKKPKKLTIWQKIKHEAQHYWDGTKLLATEVRISSKLALKMAAGYELSRREHRQLQRTVQDLGRLVPFSVFVIVPFAELLLPVALKLFPNLLPSTYEGATSREAKAAHLRATRKEVSSFLRNTLRESGLSLETLTSTKKEEFAEFFRKVRATGEAPTQQEVISVCKLFKDDLTLDNLSRPQLVAMCRYMNLNTFGTDTILRYQIRHRMRQIKRDDKAISFEGVDSLSVPELQMAAASRGLRTHGVSPARLREDLQMWLDLRLKYGVPSTLLVLSNAYIYTQSGKESEISSQIDALQAVLSSIPEELFHEIELEVHNAEGAATNKQRLEVLKEQQELIEEENEQNTTNEETGRQTPKDRIDIDEKEEKKAAAKAEAEGEGEAVEAKQKGAETDAKASKEAKSEAATENAGEEQAKEAVESEHDAQASRRQTKAQKERGTKKEGKKE
jgi:LETM1 and EF-hand domain-containing protein 1